MSSVSAFQFVKTRSTFQVFKRQIHKQKPIISIFVYVSFIHEHDYTSVMHSSMMPLIVYFPVFYVGHRLHVGIVSGLWRWSCGVCLLALRFVFANGLFPFGFSVGFQRLAFVVGLLTGVSAHVQPSFARSCESCRSFNICNSFNIWRVAGGIHRQFDIGIRV